MSTWREHRNPEPRRASESLDRIVRRFGGTESTALTAVFARWAEIAGPDIAAHAQPRSLADRVLVLSVDDPAWATQLTYLGADLARRCNELVGSEVVTRVEVRVAGSGARRDGRRSGRESAR